MRLGIVPYLNAFPLMHGLTAEIYTAPPARLLEMAGPEDILLAPIVLPFLDPNLYLIEGVGIGSFGPVETVKLFFRDNNVTIQNLKSIYLDKESLTSIALLKILLKNLYHRSLNSISFLNQMESADGTLLIGDKVWNMEHGTWNSDLGEIWTAWTHLPFVYACWMTRSRKSAEKWKNVLLDQTQKNLETLPSLVSKAPKNNCPDVLRYWRQLRYIVDDESKKGIQRFQKEWAALENKPVLELKWI